MNISLIKSEAKKSLKGKRLDAALIVIISTWLTSVFDFLLENILVPSFGDNSPIILVINLLLVMFLCSIYFGRESFYLKTSRNENVTFKELFTKTKLSWAAFGLLLVIGLMTLAGAILLIVPGIIIWITYSQAFFVKLENPDMTFDQVAKRTKQLINGHKWDYFVLNLSFIGWNLLALLMGFATELLHLKIIGDILVAVYGLWLTPYIQTAKANFYNKLLELNPAVAMVDVPPMNNGQFNNQQPMMQQPGQQPTVQQPGQQPMVQQPGQQPMMQQPVQQPMPTQQPVNEYGQPMNNVAQPVNNQNQTPNQY